MKNILFLILLFTINSYSYSWLNNIIAKVNYYNNNPKPESLADIRFNVESDTDHVLDFQFDNNINYTPSYIQKFIGSANNYKKIDICINDKWYEYGDLIDKGNYRYLFKYHPPNYDNNGNLNYAKPFSTAWSAKCIKSGVGLDVGLNLNITGAFYPILEDDYNSNTKNLDVSACSPTGEFAENYTGSYAPLYIDKPNALYFYGNKAKTVTENLLERIGNHSTGVTIKNISFINKRLNGLLTVDPKNCLGLHKDSVNCKFNITYTPPANKSIFYDGYMIIEYNTKFNHDDQQMAIYYLINNTKPIAVKGKIISHLKSGTCVKEGSKNIVTFKFTNVGNKEITGIKLKDELPEFVSQISDCSLLFPNDSCESVVVFKTNHLGTNIASTIFYYDQGPPVDLSFSVVAK